MCIIAAKPANTKMPNRDTLENMWYGNSDGAGLMYVKDGKVRIEKGLMTFKDFKAKLDEIGKTTDLTAVPVVMHFRITTHGGTCPANTHPFPVTDSVKLLQRTSLTTTMGVAHNGIIPIKPRSGISDTMEYIATQLAPLSKALPDWYRNSNALTLVKNAIQSKMAVLTGSGELVTIGDFVKDDGILYSNYSYLGWGGRYTRFGYGDWDYYGGSASGKSKSTGKSKGKSKKTNKPGSAMPKSTAAETDKPAEAVSVARKALMWLCEADPGAYVYTATGKLVEGEEFLLDSDNNLYVYDINFDYAVRRTGYRAFSSAGGNIRFDENIASMEYILDDMLFDPDGICPWDE